MHAYTVLTYVQMPPHEVYLTENATTWQTECNESAHAEDLAAVCRATSGSEECEEHTAAEFMATDLFEECNTVSLPEEGILEQAGAARHFEDATVEQLSTELSLEDCTLTRVSCAVLQTANH